MTERQRCTRDTKRGTRCKKLTSNLNTDCGSHPDATDTNERNRPLIENADLLELADLDICIDEYQRNSDAELAGDPEEDHDMVITYGE